jgi:hypothetical protein
VSKSSHRIGLFVETSDYADKQSAVEAALSKMAEAIPMHQIKLDTNRSQNNFTINLVVGSDFVSVKTELDGKPVEAG